MTAIGTDSLTLAVDYVSGRHPGPCPSRMIGRCGRGRVEEDGDSIRVGLDELSEPSLFLGGIVGSLAVSEDWWTVSGAWSEQAAAILPSAVLPAADA